MKRILCSILTSAVVLTLSACKINSNEPMEYTTTITNPDGTTTVSKGLAGAESASLGALGGSGASAGTGGAGSVSMQIVAKDGLRMCVTADLALLKKTRAEFEAAYQSDPKKGTSAIVDSCTSEGSLGVCEVVSGLSEVLYTQDETVVVGLCGLQKGKWISNSKVPLPHKPACTVNLGGWVYCTVATPDSQQVYTNFGCNLIKGVLSDSCSTTNVFGTCKNLNADVPLVQTVYYNSADPQIQSSFVASGAKTCATKGNTWTAGK